WAKLCAWSVQSLPFSGEAALNFTPGTVDAPRPEERVVAEIETLVHRLANVRSSVERVIFGQQDVVDQSLITLLAGGHALLIGVPGLAKTRLVETLGIVLGLEDK